MNNFKNNIKTRTIAFIAAILLVNTAIAQAPTNDDPCNAIPLTVNQTCTYQTFTNANATASSGVPAPGCASYSGGDVWFTITVPPSGSLTFDSESGVITDGGMAIYSGTCNNLTLISCNDDGGTGLMPQITETTANLVPGSTIYIRFWEYGNNNNGTFGICVSNPPPPPPPPPCTGNQPAGNTCDLAPNICNLNGYCGNTSSSYTANSWTQLSSAFCGSIENNSFITFVASAATASFNVWVTSSQTGSGIQMFVFNARCGSGAVASYGCANQILPTVNTPFVFSATGLTPGNTYFLMFDGFGGDVCNYVISPTAGVELVSVTPSSASLCPGGSVSLSATGGNGNFTWSGPGLGSVTGATVTVQPSQTSTYTVTSSNAAGSCPLTQNVVVTVNTPPSVTSVTGVDPTCSTLCDGSATVVANGTQPLVYTWTNNTGTTATINNLCAGSYSVTVTDANGCVSQGPQPAIVTAPPAIQLPTVVSPVDYCLGATVAQPLQATGSNLLWYTSATGGTGSIIAPTPATPVTTPSTYYVSQTVFGCESPRAPVNVTVSAPSFSIDAGGPYTFQLGVGGSFNPTLSGITSGQLTSILWTPPTDLDATNILTPTLTSNVEGTYTYYVAVTNALGCTAIDSAVVNVISECINVHNAFSPNGDGINELWEVYTSFGCLKNVSVNVYNRYGSKVYENKDYRNNWNGNYKGKPVPDGTYYAVIEFELISGKKLVKRTDVTVIR